MNPERIGRYRIVRVLGRGGFATVFLGEDRGLNDLVAIKVLSADMSANPEGVTRFVAEARVMRNLRAPGVVAVHDVGEHEGRPYFVMEYCQRGPLSDRIEQLGRPLTLAEGRGLAIAIGRAVGDLHHASPPVVHRDLKPGNLLIRQRPNRAGEPIGELLAADEELIVGDFGLAKIVNPSETKLTLIAYTRGYAPPEQVRGDGAIGPAADVYSASAILVTTMSGQQANQVFAEGDRAFDESALAATGPFRHELERGLSFSVDRRQQTIDQWATSLARIAMPGPQPPMSVPGTDLQTPTVPAFPPPSRALPATRPMPNPMPDPMPDRGAGSAPVRRRIGWRGAIVAAAALVVLGLVGLLISLRSTGPAVAGPDRSEVGVEVAFAVIEEGVTVREWEVNGVRTVDELLRLTPSTPGDVSIEVITDAGNRQLDLEVTEAASDLSIEGPAVLSLTGTTTVRAGGANGSTVTWVLGDQTFEQPTLDLQPTSSGVFVLELRSADGRAVRRTFTVPAAG